MAHLVHVELAVTILVVHRIESAPSTRHASWVPSWAHQPPRDVVLAQHEAQLGRHTLELVGIHAPPMVAVEQPVRLCTPAIDMVRWAEPWAAVHAGMRLPLSGAGGPPEFSAPASSGSRALVRHAVG